MILRRNIIRVIGLLVLGGDFMQLRAIAPPESPVKRSEEEVKEILDENTAKI